MSGTADIWTAGIWTCVCCGSSVMAYFVAVAAGAVPADNTTIGVVALAACAALTLCFLVTWVPFSRLSDPSKGRGSTPAV